VAKALKICAFSALAMVPQGIYPEDIISYVHKDLLSQMFL
jgi:hypothetical protein